jgi:alkylhydroperoxidase family enzyme
VLIERFDEPVLQIATDRNEAGLDEIDLAVMDLAERVVDDATAIDDADLQRLPDLGFSDEEIMGVVLTAAVRSFWTKTLDALGVQPDASYAELEPELREVLVVGRPIAEA